MIPQTTRKRNAVIFIPLLIIGTIIATLGSVSLPLGNKISNFWPGVVIQALGGLWFGKIGVLAGIIFPIFSNILIGGDRVQIVGFIPSSVVQSGLPLMFYYFARRRPQISSAGDFAFFIVFVCAIPMLVAGLFGPAAFYVFGGKPFILSQYPKEIYGWAIIHFRTLIIIGIPMMIWVAPKVIAARVIEPYWRDDKSVYSYHFLSVKLFLVMGLVTLFPLILIGIYQIATMPETEILRPNFIAIIITGGFFSLLIVSSIATDIVGRPVEAVIGKIEKLSKEHLLDVKIAALRNGNDRFAQVSQAIDELFIKLQSYERARAMQEISAQVAHDIRSPLAALDSVVKDVSHLSEEKRIIIRSAVGRIRDIANHLLEKNRAISAADKNSAAGSSDAETEPAAVQLLSSLIEPLITEKRLQFRSKIGIEIDSRLDASSYGLFAKVQSTEFKRTLSNLINNSVEAMDNGGSALIGMSQEDGTVLIKVEDNGKGIPREILAKLGQRGETHGKVGGSGLGLYHARTSVERWGGGLDVASAPGKGTTITISIPSAKPPEWFVSELQLAANSAVVILDDDTSIHQVWDERLKSARVKEHGVEVFHFSSPDELRAFARGNTEAETALYLTDHELLGYKETGLRLVAELGINERAILVTSRYEEKPVLENCIKLKVRMIPKGLAGLVPITMTEPGLRTEGLEPGTTDAGLSPQSPVPGPASAVLIDDDALVHMTWKMSAKMKGATLQAYEKPEDFLAECSFLDKGAAIYIDSELGGGVKGEDIARTLHEKGFANIYMETGHPPEQFRHLGFIKGVLSKDPPWE